MANLGTIGYTVTSGHVDRSINRVTATVLGMVGTLRKNINVLIITFPGQSSPDTRPRIIGG